MASLIRVGFARIVNNAVPNPCVTYIGVRNISGKTMRVKAPKAKPAPWPYKTKKYRYIDTLYDKTTHRLDENSKVNKLQLERTISELSFTAYRSRRPRCGRQVEIRSRTSRRIGNGLFPGS